MLGKALLATAFGAGLSAAVTSLEVQGNQFVNPTTGNTFQIVGMAYQIGGSAGYDPSHGKDPLSNADVCKRDAALMQILGVNTIRVYNLDPNLDHNECASIFNAAGMYMIIDVNSPLAGESLNSEKPWESYYAAYVNRTFAIVEAFKSYPNTLGFFSGNEVINDIDTGSTVPPYVRAVTRDLKNYIKNHADRAIPVGYSAADVRDVLQDTYNYFTCAIDGNDDDMSRADMFALNSYSWCGESTFQESGYDQLVAMFKDATVPIFYSEFGCNTPSPRVFTEIGTIYGDEMTGTFMGGVVYEFAQEDNNYGLAQINDDESVDLLADFRTLQNQYNQVDFATVQSVKASSNTNQIPECSADLITEEGFANNFTIPSLDDIQDLIDNGIDNKPSGQIVDISDYTVAHEIRDTDGSVLSNVAVSPLADDESNTPGTNSGGGSSSGNGTSSGGDSDNTDSAAPRLAPQGPVSAGLLIAPLVLALSFAAGFSLV
ncbi:glycoside hydrolase family 72 protein [Xylariomycetidae sp. FL2044]|nr:glycoside hydrolase family 72 protein [Xylariomycetidae sp. FL2044]